MSAAPWRCSKCPAVVFIPTPSIINGGVCTQQRKGCDGELVAMSTDEASDVRGMMERNGISEQPWLTLVFSNGTVAA